MYQKSQIWPERKGAQFAFHKSPQQFLGISLFCVPIRWGEPRITLSTALSIAEPRAGPAFTLASVPAQHSLTLRLSCENQSSASRTHHSAAAGPQLFLSPQEAGGQGRAGLLSREVLL